MPLTSEGKDNLWIAALRSYWADPANVIGPPGALVRRIMKALWLVLSVYVLFWIAGPSQVASWKLWMQDDELATHIAWGFTFAAALCFAIVGYVASETQPLRVPLIVPLVEFEERKFKGWRIKPMHLHVPNVRVAMGSVLAFALFVIALLGQWNYYLHDNLTTGGASVAALEGSASRVQEAERALQEFEARTAAAAAAATLAIEQTSAGSPTGRSRLVRQQAEAAAIAASERRELQAELRAARSETVTTRATASDPRPVDGHVATATGLDRGLVSSLLDLLRSGVVEALLVMGAGLGLAGATSRIGVPASENVPREKRVAPETETVAETQAAPSEEPVAPKPRRFTLPHAMAQDFERAAVVGPQPWAKEPPAEARVDDDPEPVAEPAPEHVDEIDPLLAEAAAAAQGAELENA